MSQTHNLETQLRSWTLRQPSPKVEAALFRSAANLTVPEDPHGAEPLFRLAWIAPSGIALLVATLSLWSGPSFERQTAQVDIVVTSHLDRSSANHIARVSATRPAPAAGNLASPNSGSLTTLVSVPFSRTNL